MMDNTPQLRNELFPRRLSTISTLGIACTTSSGTLKPCRPTSHAPCVEPLSKARSRTLKAGYSRVKRSTSSMFKTKSKTISPKSSGDTSVSSNSLPDRGPSLSLAELDARLQLLKNCELSEENLPEAAQIFPAQAPSRVCLTPHFMTPRWEGVSYSPSTSPLSQVSENEHENEPTTPHPNLNSGIMHAKTRAETVFLYLAACIVAIPNMALSWPPMTIAIILGSAVAVLCGYRFAVAVPVVVLLNPASPLWRTNDARKKGNDVLVITAQHQSHQSQHSAARKKHHTHSRQPSRQPSSPPKVQMRPRGPARRHSTL
ncbi:hypothetical protein K439DRAFT_1624070 [Ramaria rubella]|nr:hypothetical protein K439DRAFT_1624070 [Ramaria rubella]